jgi:hypothetical protein
VEPAQQSATLTSLNFELSLVDDPPPPRP